MTEWRITMHPVGRRWEARAARPKPEWTFGAILPWERQYDDTYEADGRTWRVSKRFTARSHARAARKAQRWVAARLAEEQAAVDARARELDEYREALP